MNSSLSSPSLPTEYKLTITEITVHDKSRSPLTHLDTTVVKLEDEGGGAYITISQGEDEIRFDLDELPLVNEAVDRLMMQHKGTNKASSFEGPAYLTWGK
jgi:hypothetical protein